MADQKKEQPNLPTGTGNHYKAQVIAIVLEDIENGGRIFRAIMTQLKQKLSTRGMELGIES